MAEVVRYVDPDATGAGDGTSWTDAYTSLSAWEAAEQTDLVTDGDWHHVYCRSSAGTADTTATFLNGWTTDATHYILIEAASTDRADKTGIDTSKYRLSTGSGVPVNVYEDYVRIDGLQFSVTTASNIVGCNYSNASSADVRVTNCYAEVTGAGNLCIAFNTGDRHLTIETTVVHGTDRAVYSNGGDVDIFNSVFYGDGTNYGIRRDSAGTVTVTNCAVFNFSDDFVGTVTIDHCASDDGDGTNSVAPSGADWANEFEDAANGDFTLLAGGNLENGGTTITGGPSTDIDGDSWDATPSIGVDEIAAGGTTFDVSAADGISLGDAPGGALTISAAVSDGVGMGDAPGGGLTMPASVLDGLVLSESVVSQITFNVSLADGITLSDQTTEGGVISVSVADGVSLGDSPSGVLAILASIADGISAGDAASSTATINATLADGVSFSDAVSAAIQILASVSDGIKLSDVAVDTTFLPTGEVRVTVSSSQATVAITAKQAGVAVTAKQASVQVTT